MAFSIYALLGEGAPAFSAESLASDLREYFHRDKDLSVEFEQVPFSKDKSVLLHWGTWWISVFYEEGRKVLDDSHEIAKILGKDSSDSLETISRRIRLVFGSDDSKMYTNKIIRMIEFVQKIHGAIVFDPQQKDLVH